MKTEKIVEVLKANIKLNVTGCDDTKNQKVEIIGFEEAAEAINAQFEQSEKDEKRSLLIDFCD